MMVRRFAVLVLAATLLAAACGGDPPPPPPPPAPTGPTAEEIARARADSIARAQAAADAQRTAAEAAAARAREAAVATARTALDAMVFFDYDVSDIRTDAQTILRQKADVLRASPQVQLRIEGHADERGSTEYNLALSNRRAESVRQFLTGFGLAETRFTIVPLGEERPLEMGSTEAAWARNRRAQFQITAGENAIVPPQN